MLDNMRRLHPRGPANAGICVDRDGAMLGPDCILVDRTPRGFSGINREAASVLQKCALGINRDDDWLFRQCERIAESLNKGDVALAQIYGLRIPVGRLDGLKRLSAASFTKWSFNPDEPRIPAGDPHGGEWTTGGDEGVGVTSPFATAGDDAGPAIDGGGDDDGGEQDGGAGVSLDALSLDDASPESDSTAAEDGTAPSGDSSPSGGTNSNDGSTTTGGTSGSSGQLLTPALGYLGDESQWLLNELPEAALKQLLARMTGAGIVFRILFIPTNQSPITEGSIANSPDLSYRYDSDTGVLQLRQDIGSLGSVVFDEAHIGTDGLFRDAQGQVIGRYLSGSGVVIDLGALPGYQTGSETDQDQPKLCPDPNAEDITGRSERSLAYQEQISGLPRGLEVKLNGVRFDGCIDADGTMLEAKGPGFENKMDGPDDWLGWFTGDEKIELQMFNQQRAVSAAGTTVEWHFAEEPVADFFRKFAEKNGLSKIVVFYTPPRQR